jgi:hypothetical protein
MMKIRWAACTDPVRLDTSLLENLSICPSLKERAMRAEIADLKTAIDQSTALLRRRL